MGISPISSTKKEEGKIAIYLLFLNYLTKQPFFQSIYQDISVLEVDIADIEFYLELDINNVVFYVYF